MSEPTCRACWKENGVLVKAVRILPGGNAACQVHYESWLRAQHSPSPSPSPSAPAVTTTNAPITPQASLEVNFQEKPREDEEEKPVPLKRTDVNWTAAQKDYDAGMKAPKIAEKYGVHVSSVYLHLKKNKMKPGRVAPAQPVVSAPAQSSNGSNGFLATLKAKRDALNTVIEIIEREGL
jgi:hypothetical protein